MHESNLTEVLQLSPRRMQHSLQIIHISNI